MQIIPENFADPTACRECSTAEKLIWPGTKPSNVKSFKLSTLRGALSLFAGESSASCKAQNKRSLGFTALDLVRTPGDFCLSRISAPRDAGAVLNVIGNQSATAFDGCPLATYLQPRPGIRQHKPLPSATADQSESPSARCELCCTKLLGRYPSAACPAGSRATPPACGGACR